MAAALAQLAARLVRSLTAATFGGALTGLLVGGILGRLVMRLIAVLSPQAQGVITDDAAAVGEISLAGSLTLAAFTSALGAVGGLLYLLCCRVLPPGRARVGGFALFTAALGGGLFIHDVTSVDFGLLSPRWLSAAAFILLPLIYGLLAPLAVDGLTRRFARIHWLAAAPIGLVSLVYPETMLLGLAVYAICLAVQAIPALLALWRSRFVTVAGLVMLTAVTAFGLYSLGWDIASLLADRSLDPPPTL